MKATIALALLLAFALGAFGPALDAAPEPTTPARTRFAVAAEKMCGSENAAWQETSPGVVQCYTHRGAKTITAKVQP